MAILGQQQNPDEALERLERPVGPAVLLEHYLFSAFPFAYSSLPH